jgi:hypothetical protein
MAIVFAVTARHGTGTDAAIEADDLTLVRGDLRVAADGIRLSRATLRTIKGNLFWAFACNIGADDRAEAEAEAEAEQSERHQVEAASGDCAKHAGIVGRRVRRFGGTKRTGR